MKRRNQMSKREKFNSYMSAPLMRDIQQMRMVLRLARRYGVYTVQVSKQKTEVYVNVKHLLHSTVNQM